MSNKQNANALTDLPNIGPKIAIKLNRIGIENKDAFLARDPYDVYTELLEHVDPTLCRCLLASLVGAARGKKWHMITKQAAAEYQKRRPEHTWKDKC